MKTRISKIFGVGLTIALLASLMVSAVPASAGTLSWGTSDGDNPADSTKHVVVDGLDIIDIEANGDVVYAATDVDDTPLYKSSDGGATWANLGTSTSFPDANVKAVAVAPDDPDVVVIVTDDDTVEFSTNGGSSWTDLDNPDSGGSATLDCVDISAGTPRYIVAGGALSGEAVMYIIKLDMAEDWEEQYDSNEGATENSELGANASADNMLAVKFSRNFSTDKAVLAVTTSATDDTATLQIYRDEDGDQDWNGEIDYLNYADWHDGIEIQGSLGGGAVAAEIAMPDSYLANDEGERVAYVSVASADGDDSGGVYRITDVVVKKFDTWSGGEPGDCGSLAYNEAGKIVAGAYDDNLVYQYLSPSDTTPKASRTNTYKQPGGEEKTVVTYAGDNVLAGTSGDESAVAVSSDDGYSFYDIGLIDTSLDTLTDVAVTADGSMVYLASYTGSALSLWMKDSAWKRVLSLASYDDVVVRIAPDDDSAIYLADTSGNTKDVYFSPNGGMETWKKVPCYKVEEIQDLAVESTDVAYVLDSDEGVSKTTNSGASWGTAKQPVDDFSGYMITVASNGDIFVGGSSDYYAYSTDGGSTFTRSAAFASGDVVQIACDEDYADNGVIYAAAGSDVYRGGADTSKPADRGDLGSGFTAKGIVDVGGVTYVIADDGTESKLYKSMSLETASSAAGAGWSSTTATDENYTRAPQALKLSHSDGMPKLWAIDTDSKRLESFVDAVAFVGPSLSSPANDDEVSVNQGNGNAYDVTFIFEKYDDSDIDNAQLQIAADSGFKAIVFDDDSISLTGATKALVIGPTGNDGTVSYLPGETYYWRVRSTTPLRSPWSESRSFTIGSLDTFVIESPMPGANDVVLMPTLTWAEYPDAIGYEVMLSEDPSFTIIEWSYNVDNPFYKIDEALKYSTTYYWRARGVTGEPYLVGSTWVTPAGPWVTGVFTTMAEPVEQEPTVITVPEAAEPPEVVTVEVPAPAPVIPTYILWVIVVIGAILVIALIVLIVRTRRVP